LTGCLTIAAAAALAVPAMAADMSGTVGGRAAADLISYSKTPVDSTGKSGDSYSYMDMQAEGRLSYELKATEGDWTSTGKFEIRSNNGTTYASNPIVLQKYFQLENEAVSFALGTKVWGFVYLTPYVGVSSAWDRYCYGCGSITGQFGLSSSYRDDRLTIGIKQAGIQLFYATSKVDEEVDVDIDGTTDVTATNLQKTGYGLQYDGNFGPVTLVLAYQTRSYAAIENLSTAKDGALDGANSTELALAVRYAIQEGTFVEVDYEGSTFKYGNKVGTSISDDTQTQNTMGLAFAMALSEAQGFMVSYDQSTYNTGVSGAKDVVATKLVASFNQKLGGQQVWAAYQADTNKNGDNDAVNESKIALGGRVSF
jgi:hypothetical protein